MLYGKQGIMREYMERKGAGWSGTEDDAGIFRGNGNRMWKSVRGYKPLIYKINTPCCNMLNLICYMIQRTYLIKFESLY